MLVLITLHHAHAGYRLFSRLPYLAGHLAVYLELSGQTSACSTLNYRSTFSRCQLQGQIDWHALGHDHPVRCPPFKHGESSESAPRGFSRLASCDDGERPLHFSPSTELIVQVCSYCTSVFVFVDIIPAILLLEHQKDESKTEL